jgi:hypothetical protein
MIISSTFGYYAGRLIIKYLVGTALSRFCNIYGPAADAKDILGIQQREDLGPLVPILAAVTVYLLLAFSFATIYNTAFQFDFRSFRLPEWIAAGSAEVLRTEMIYFSLVTLATLGYADILPSSPSPRCWRCWRR